MLKDRVKLSEIGRYVDKEVNIYGWIEGKRIVGQVAFLIIRDMTGKTQVTIKKNVKRHLYNLALTIPRQSTIKVYGKVNLFGNTLEVIPDEIKVLSQARQPLPIDPTGRVPATLPTIIDNRPLSLRIPKIRAVFQLRALTKQIMREYFIERGFIEVDTPKIIATATEGGANLFEIKYFERIAYLAQSPQLYKEQLTMAFDGVFEIAQFYRAEKSHTRRHLTEFTSVDLEVAYADYKDVMDILEEMIIRLLKEVKRRGEGIYKTLEYSPPDPPTNIERITYDQALDIIKSKGGELKWGEDIESGELELLSEEYPEFYFITDWPWDIKPFYIRKKGDLTESFDLMMGRLELSSGGTREHEYNSLRRNIREKGLKVESFNYHTRFYQYGMPPHAGFGLGLDRLMTILTGRENIREVVLYPRDPESLTP
jgi:aspartyl-tRNA synthetase